MAVKTWEISGTSGDWSGASNWTPAGAPAAGDDVSIPRGTGSNGVILDIAATPPLDSVTVGGAFLSVGANTLNVTGTGPGATDTITFSLPPQGGSFSDVRGGTIVARNLSLSNGAFEGFGTLAISGDISGSGVINADGPASKSPGAVGTLAITGTIEPGIELSITPAVANNVVLSVLEILGTATSSTFIGVNDHYQMLEIGPNGGVTINASETIGSTIKLEGPASRLTLGTHPLAITNFGNLTGAGIVTASTISGGGTVSAVGGTLELSQGIAAATGLTFDIAAASRLQFDGTVGAGNTFTFLASGQASVGLGNDAGFTGTFANVNVGTGTAITNFVDIEGHTVSISSEQGHATNTGTIALSDGAILGLANLTSTTWFAHTASDGAGGTDVFVTDTPACFCRGTLISAEHGEVPIERLAVGDRVRTLSGVLKPIMWIGMGRDLVTRNNRLARPVIVRRGALADNVPCRDLYLTHGHALYLDGVLIPVEHLINHHSIEWDQTARVVEYYHAELADHDVLLAEGAPAESYHDVGNRARFQNTRPGSQTATQGPTYAPVLTGGDIVENTWLRLLRRAGGEFPGATTDDPDLHLLIDGDRHDPVAVAVADGVYRFVVGQPPFGGSLRLRSRSGVPSLTGLNRHEHRRLGVAIRQIVLHAPGVLTCFDHDAPLFVNGGGYRPEHGHCWTDGDFDLPASAFAHLGDPFGLVVHTRPRAMRYALDGRRLDDSGVRDGSFVRRT